MAVGDFDGEAGFGDNRFQSFADKLFIGRIGKHYPQPKGSEVSGPKRKEVMEEQNPGKTDHGCGDRESVVFFFELIEECFAFPKEIRKKRGAFFLGFDLISFATAAIEQRFFAFYFIFN